MVEAKPGNVVWRRISPLGLDERMREVALVSPLRRGAVPQFAQLPTPSSTFRSARDSFPSTTRVFIYKVLLPEILGMIFELALCDQGHLAVGMNGDVPFRQSDWYSEADNFRHVCRGWMKAIDGHAKLSTYVSGEDTIARTERVVKQARNLPLVADFWLTKETSYANVAATVAAIGQHPISALLVYYDYQKRKEGKDTDRLIHFLGQSSFSSVQTAWVIIKCSKEIPSSVKFLGGQESSITDLSLQLGGKFTLFPRSFPHLRRLCLSGSPVQSLPPEHELLAMLRNTDLRELDLRNYRCRSTSRKQLHGTELITLPNLERVSITNTPLGVMWRILLKVNAPSCKVTELTTDIAAGRANTVREDTFYQVYADYIERTLSSTILPSKITLHAALTGFEVEGRNFSFCGRVNASAAQMPTDVMFDNVKNIRRLFAAWLELPMAPARNSLRILSLTEINGRDTDAQHVLLRTLNTAPFPNLEEIQLTDEARCSINSISRSHNVADHVPPQLHFLQLPRLRIILTCSRIEADLQRDVEAVVAARPLIQVTLDGSGCTGKVSTTRRWTNADRIEVIQPEVKSSWVGELLRWIW